MTQANSSTINHYQQLTAEERSEIEAYLNTDMSQADIARRLHRSRSTISRKTEVVHHRLFNQKRIRNQEIMPQYYIKDDHEAIIPKDLFHRVQEERKRRRAGIKVPSGKTRHYNNRTCFSLKVFCGRCGDIYHRVAYNYSDEHGQVVKWLCMTGHDHDLVTCHGRAISERQLKEVCLKAFNKIIEPNKAFRAKLQNNIRHAISQLNEEQATKLDRELDRLQILLINQTPHSKDYDKIAGEFNKVQQQRDELQLTLDRQNEVSTP